MSLSAPETEPIKRLASYLRENPSALGMDPMEIAAACNAPIELVQSALGAPKSSVPKDVARTRRKNWIQPSWVRLIQAIDTNEKHTYLVVLATLMVAYLAGLVTDAIMKNSGQLLAREVTKGCIFSVIGSVHMLLYFRHGRSRHPLLGGVVLWVLATISALSSSSRVSQLDPAVRFILIPFGTGIVATVYVSVGIAISVIGGYAKVRREERSVTRMTRQQLLERLFAIEAALSREQTEVQASWESLPTFAYLHQHLLKVTLIAGFGLSLISGAVNAFGNTYGKDSQVFFVIGSFFIVLIRFVCQILLCFLGGNLRRSLFVSVVFLVAGWVSILPIWLLSVIMREPRLYHEADPVRNQFVPQIFGLVFALGIGLFAGMGAHLEARSRRSRKLKGNDPETLLSELVSIQQLLNPTAGVKAVLVVDAAKSSQMKAGSDPLTAEWSFRAYQEFLDKIVREAHGNVHATAGDGAVAIFNSSEDAFLAAQTIQTQIDDFNANVNRLKVPFRLRIGIHSDRIGGDLNQVQFAAVIDIAAHVEGTAPVGGIAVTERVASTLEGHRFASLPDPVDGQAVLIAVQPTLEIR